MLVLKRLIAVLVLLAVFAGSVIFSLQNTQQVPMDLVLIMLDEQSLAFWVLSAFVLGGLCGVLVAIGLYLGVKRSELGVRQKLKRHEQELHKLRTSAYKS